MVEFVLVAPVILVLLLVVADFARFFATGIAVESAARDAAEVAAQEYLRNPPAPIGSPAPSPGNPTYYDAIDGYAVSTLCNELGGQPNAGSDCSAIPMYVCVHDGADPNCGTVYPASAMVPAGCTSFATPPTDTQTDGTETSRYVEVRVCYRFSTLFNISNIAGIGTPFGNSYIERDRVFTVADY